MMHFCPENSILVLVVPTCNILKIVSQNTENMYGLHLSLSWKADKMQKEILFLAKRWLIMKKTIYIKFVAANKHTWSAA